MVLLIYVFSLFFGLTLGQCNDMGCFCSGKVLSCGNIKTFPTSYPSDIKTIVIYEMDIDAIPSDLSRKVPYLTSFTVHFGKIGKIAGGAFSNLRNVNEISFFQSVITLVESNAFSDINNITNVFFYNTSIGEIQENSFTKIKLLHHFQISMGKITVVRQNAFNMISDIETFQIQDSSFDLLEEQSLNNFVRMKYFLIHDNTFKMFKCMSLEPFFAVANESAFYKNVFVCSCDLQWIVQDHVTHSFLFSNWCEENKTRFSLDQYDFQSLGCSNVTDICSESFEITVATVTMHSTTPPVTTKELTTKQQTEFPTSSTVKHQNKASSFPKYHEELTTTTPSTTSSTQLTTRAFKSSQAPSQEPAVDSSSISTTTRSTPEVSSETSKSTNIPKATTHLSRKTTGKPQNNKTNNSPNLQAHFRFLLMTFISLMWPLVL